MSDLSEITCQEIENKLMIVLTAFENVRLSLFVLYNKLIDKYDTNSLRVSPTFKAKFMLVFRNLEKI